MPIPEDVILTMIRPLQDKYYANFTNEDMVRSIVAQEGDKSGNILGVDSEGSLVADSGAFGGFLNKQLKTLNNIKKM